MLREKCRPEVPRHEKGHFYFYTANIEPAKFLSAHQWVLRGVNAQPSIKASDVGKYAGRRRRLKRAPPRPKPPIYSTAHRGISDQDVYMVNSV